MRRQRPFVRMVGFGVTVLIALVAPACSSGDEERASDTGTWSDLPVVGLSFRTSVDELTRAIQKVDDAINAKAAACLEGMGYTDGAFAPGSAEIIATGNLFRPASVADAEANGLNQTRFVVAQMTAPTASVPPGPVGGSAVPFDPQAFMKAQQTCSTAADDGTLEALGPLKDSYTTTVLTAPPIAAARRSWAQCMADDGFAGITSVRDLAASVRDDTAEDQLAALPVKDRPEKVDDLIDAERPAALAVVHCDTSEYGPVIAAWARLEATWQDEHADAWNAVSEKGRLLFGSFLDI